MHRNKEFANESNIQKYFIDDVFSRKILYYVCCIVNLSRAYWMDTNLYSILK